MPDSQIEEIKNRLNIVEVISSYIKLKKAGANWKALCPFHSEKTPSFIVSPSRQIWHCFGACDSGGDIFKFVMQIEGIEFGDALRMLADKAGIQLKSEDPRLRTERSQLYELNERACQYFEKCLQVKKDALTYLKKRGLSKETIREFRLGYAPAKTKVLASNLRMFRERIMFPICDLNGRVIAFTGRLIKEKKDEGKYINSPDSLIYKKSQILYGLDKAKTAIRKKDMAVLVEGNMDVIASYQADVKNVVASSGTALTKDQLRIIKRYTNNLAICFDMDLAGGVATKRSIDLAIEQGMNVKVIVLEDKDPAECIKRNKRAWQIAIKKAQPVIEYYFADTFSRHDPQKVAGKKQIGQILLPVLKKIPSKIEQAHWIQELAKRLNVEEKILADEISNLKFAPSETRLRRKQISSRRQSGYGASATKPNLKSQIFEKAKKSRRGILEERLAGLCFIYGKKSNLLKKFEDKKDELILKIEQEEITEPQKEIEVCLRELELLRYREKMEKMSLKIKKAEQEKNQKLVQNLLKKFNQLSQIYAQR